jgi:hypothetical protein
VWRRSAHASTSAVTPLKGYGLQATVVEDAKIGHLQTGKEPALLGVGNILQVNRGTSPAPGSLAILNFTPQQGGPGSSVTILGQGFSSTASSNTVKFNGTAATVVSASPTTLLVTVPGTASSGPITVTANGQTATSGSSFTFIPFPNKIRSPASRYSMLQLSLDRN